MRAHLGSNTNSIATSSWVHQHIGARSPGRSRSPDRQLASQPPWRSPGRKPCRDTGTATSIAMPTSSQLKQQAKRAVDTQHTGASQLASMSMLRKMLSPRTYLNDPMQSIRPNQRGPMASGGLAQPAWSSGGLASTPLRHDPEGSSVLSLSPSMAPTHSPDSPTGNKLPPGFLTSPGRHHKLIFIGDAHLAAN